MSTLPFTSPCTPQTLSALAPCFRCFSKLELLAILTVLLKSIADARAEQESTLDELLDQAACFNCTDGKLKLEMLVAMVVAMMGDESTPDEFREQIKCYTCLSENQLYSLLLYLLCMTEIFEQRQPN